MSLIWREYMPHKIAFIGTHGICKTTYAFMLAAHLKRMNKHTSIVQEVARNCPLTINEQTSKMAQIWILNEQMKQEIEHSNKSDYIVCDRSTLDNYAYYLYSLQGNLALEKFFVEQWATSYAAFVYIVPNPELAIEDDGCRSQDREFQIGIDDTVQRLLKKYNIEYHKFRNTYDKDVQEEQIELLIKQLEFKKIL